MPDEQTQLPLSSHLSPGRNDAVLSATDSLSVDEC